MFIFPSETVCSFSHNSHADVFKLAFKLPAVGVVPLGVLTVISGSICRRMVVVQMRVMKIKDMYEKKRLKYQ
jgi:hypothetical protein